MCSDCAPKSSENIAKQATVADGYVQAFIEQAPCARSWPSLYAVLLAEGFLAAMSKSRITLWAVRHAGCQRK